MDKFKGHSKNSDKLPSKGYRQGCGAGLSLVPVAAVEQRIEPRYHANVKASLHSEQGLKSHCLLTNLSLSGLQLQLSAVAVQQLMPVDYTHSLHQPVHFKIEFQVPTSQCLDSPVSIDCSMIYCRRHNASEFLLGAKFSHFHNSGDLVLKDYIETNGVAF